MQKHLKLITVLGFLSLTITGCNSHTNSSASSETRSSSSAQSSSSAASSSSQSSSSSSIAPKKYSVIWQNYNGLVLELDEEVLEGTTPTYDGVTPVKEQDAQYDYVFSGWTPEVAPISQNMTYVATFTPELRKYTVIWKDEDGDVLETDTDVPYGSMPTFDAEAPTKESTVESTYTFDGWTEEVKEVTGDATYIAKYKEDVRKYTITWKNEDGSVIKSEEVAYGQTPAFEGEIPTKESTAQYKYTFVDWSPNIATVTSDAEYSATFKEETRTYTITWVNYDGTVLQTDELEYGQTPVYSSEDPSRPDEHGMKYNWKGWSPTPVPVYRDTVYTAKYSYKAFFDFSLMDYELEEGCSESDLQGAPWINSNMEGQLDKIKKPSLKDDFYASVNYDDIKEGVPGPFEVDDELVKEANNDIFNNTKETTNGDYLSAFYNKISDGDAETVSDYFSNLDVDTYLSSKEIFLSKTSLLELLAREDGTYEVQYNDGYIDDSISINTLWFFERYYPGQFTDAISTIDNKLNSVFNLALDSKDFSTIINMDSSLTNTAYHSYNSYGYNAYNSYTVDTLPWSQMQSALVDLGLDGEQPIIVRKCWTNALNTLFNSYAVNQAEDLKNEICLRLAFDYRFIMGAANYKTISGAIGGTGYFSRENGLESLGLKALARGMLKAALPILYEQSYIQLQSTEETKATVAELIEDVLQGYKDMMGEIDWLSTSTKNRIVRKLDYMKYQSCYSDRYKNFSKIDDTDLEEASLLDLFNRFYETLVDDTLNYVLPEEYAWAWDSMPSYTVNAFYATQYNTFVILNGIVPGFLGNSLEEMYGMLGFVIGHEITHAFDSSGSYYDENGRYSDLMTATDRSNFNSKVNKLISFYNKINLFGTQMVDGDRVDGEATADMGGIKVMLKLAEAIPDFDYDVFFRAAARTWCRQPYDGSSIWGMVYDAHPFAYLRVNVTLAQFDEFYETYDIGPGDGMYIPEEQRVKVW